MSVTYLPDFYGPPPGTPTTGFSVYSYKGGEKSHRPFWVPNDHTGSRPTVTERRYRVNPELVPRLNRRHDGTSTGNRHATPRSLPRTPGTVSEFETECIRKIWMELDSDERGDLLPRSQTTIRVPPEIKLGQRSLTLAELEKRAGISRSGFVERSRTDLPSRVSGSRAPRDNPTTIREQRAQRMELTTAKFYTALNRPVSKKPESAPIRALTQVAPPVPALLTPRHSASKYTKRDITIWKNEVKKVVPDRPNLTIPTDYKPKHQWEFGEEYIKVSDPMFYHAKRAAPPREYMINDEWFSEKQPQLKTKGAGVFVSF